MQTHHTLAHPKCTHVHTHITSTLRETQTHLHTHPKYTHMCTHTPHAHIHHTDGHTPQTYTQTCIHTTQTHINCRHTHSYAHIHTHTHATHTDTHAEFKGAHHYFDIKQSDDLCGQLQSKTPFHPQIYN